MTLSSILALQRSAQKLLSVGLLLIAVPLLLGGTGNGREDAVHMRLNHAPTGTALLDWTSDHGGTMTVAISLTGLTPNSTHPAHIHTGTCTKMGSVEYALNNVVANAVGHGTSRTSITGLKNGIPVSAIKVHNGPTLVKSNTPWQDQFLSIACGNTVRREMNANQSTETVVLGTTPDIDQNVSGPAMMQIAQGKLVVTMTLTHLQPNSQHVAHVHTGSCASQGSVKYNLNTLSANGAGTATSKTVIDGVNSIPHNGWYINVHLAPTMADLATQTGFAPIACGNIVGTP